MHYRLIRSRRPSVSSLHLLALAALDQTVAALAAGILVVGAGWDSCWRRLLGLVALAGGDDGGHPGSAWRQLSAWNEVAHQVHVDIVLVIVASLAALLALLARLDICSGLGLQRGIKAVRSGGH